MAPKSKNRLQHWGKMKKSSIFMATFNTVLLESAFAQKPMPVCKSQIKASVHHGHMSHALPSAVKESAINDNQMA
jgi:hypothetical protein